MKDKTFIEYSGAKPICTVCKKTDGIIRLPYYANRLEATKAISCMCDKCFSKVFAGEN